MITPEFTKEQVFGELNNANENSNGAILKWSVAMIAVDMTTYCEDFEDVDPEDPTLLSHISEWKRLRTS